MYRTWSSTPFEQSTPTSDVGPVVSKSAPTLMDAGMACWAMAGADPAAWSARTMMNAAHAALTRACVCIVLPPSWSDHNGLEEDASGRGRATSFPEQTREAAYGATFLTVTLLITSSSVRFPAALIAKSHPQVLANAASPMRTVYETHPGETWTHCQGVKR